MVFLHHFLTPKIKWRARSQGQTWRSRRRLEKVVTKSKAQIELKLVGKCDRQHQRLFSVLGKKKRLGMMLSYQQLAGSNTCSAWCAAGVLVKQKVWTKSHRRGKERGGREGGKDWKNNQSPWSFKLNNILNPLLVRDANHVYSELLYSCQVTSRMLCHQSLLGPSTKGKPLSPLED